MSRAAIHLVTRQRLPSGRRRRTGGMVALLLYAYTQGIYASRRIAKGCEERSTSWR